MSLCQLPAPRGSCRLRLKSHRAFDERDLDLLRDVKEAYGMSRRTADIMSMAVASFLLAAAFANALPPARNERPAPSAASAARSTELGQDSWCPFVQHSDGGTLPLMQRCLPEL